MDQHQRPFAPSTSRAWTAMVATILVAAMTFGACASDSRQEVRSRGRGTASAGAATPSTAPATTVAAPPPAFDETRARYEAIRAPAGTPVGRAPAAVVDDVALRSAVRARSGTQAVSTARRIRITGGPFPYGDARVLVLVDGRSVGEGQVGDQGRTLTVAVLDQSLVHDGVVIGYQIQPRPAVTVGTLRTGG